MTVLSASPIVVLLWLAYSALCCVAVVFGVALVIGLLFYLVKDVFSFFDPEQQRRLRDQQTRRL